MKLSKHEYIRLKSLLKKLTLEGPQVEFETGEIRRSRAVVKPENERRIFFMELVSRKIREWLRRTLGKELVFRNKETLRRRLKLVFGDR